MAQVIHVCRHCGFEAYLGPDSCPTCGAVERVPSRAALQVAGLALPTRSVRRLPITPPLRLVEPLPPAPAEAARSAFHGASLFVLLSLVGLLLSVVASPTWLGFALPDGTQSIVDRLTSLAAWGAVGLTGLGVAAAGVTVMRNRGR